MLLLLTYYIYVYIIYIHSHTRSTHTPVSRDLTFRIMLQNTGTSPLCTCPAVWPVSAVLWLAFGIFCFRWVCSDLSWSVQPLTLDQNLTSGFISWPKESVLKVPQLCSLGDLKFHIGCTCPPACLSPCIALQLAWYPVYFHFICNLYWSIGLHSHFSKWPEKPDICWWRKYWNIYTHSTVERVLSHAQPQHYNLCWICLISRDQVLLPVLQ